MSKKTSGSKLLTDVELELMNIIWSLGEATIKAVQDRLPKERSLAYTTVATMMKILEQKKIIRSQKNDRIHTFVPLLDKEEYESRTLSHVREKLFEGNPSFMVTRLLDDSDLSREELKSLRALLDERLKS